ncbi:MAG: type II secretion system protein [Planctomycetota bacterium]|jgi:hypothetical protein
MIRRSGISLPDILVAILLLGIWVSITIPYISGLGPESRSSNLTSDLRRMRSWIERCKAQLPAVRGDIFDSLFCRTARKTNPDNPLSGRGTLHIEDVAAGTNIAGGKFDTRAGAFQADDSLDHALL